MTILSQLAHTFSLNPDLVGTVQQAGLLPAFLDPVNIINWLNQFGLVEIGILAIIFAETGLLIGFFLPGDSVLFTVGMFYANPATASTFHIPFWLQIFFIFLAAFIGDQVGYYIGKKAGPKVFNKPDSRLFKREYVDKTNAYFERFGGRTVVLARFVPIVRTFTPVAAGIAHMKYRTFILYNCVGALAWGVGVSLLGYWLGSWTFVQENIEYIFVAIVFVSVIPILLELRKGAKESKRKTGAHVAERERDRSADLGQ